ncbi:lipopolysaccharide-induced tumor necrosis factor-alpha factor homolog isoform X2 [Melanotaenia boesemani]|nr:lipopolysaccharide-induced tumor necrosis factor-alpha factor homolog isoform X2 [Melanotaenia boesemani]
MDPPSYQEASRHPPAQSTEGLNFSGPPPLAYNTFASPTTPPPSYGDTVQRDLFPVLIPPSVPAVEPPRAQDAGFIVHPVSQIGVTPPVRSTRVQTVAVVSQPQPVPILVEYLRDIPGLVHCTHCQQLVTSKVKYVPGAAAWCSCVFLALMGLFCGCCLIPLMIRGMQNVIHSCPHCGKQLHVYKR